MTIPQLSVFLGTSNTSLARMTETLAGAGINVWAISMSFESSYGVARILVDAPQQARELLSRSGFAVNAADVVAVRTPNRAGTLARVTKALADADIPLEYMYGSLAPGATEVAIVIRTSQMAKALDVLGASGFRPLAPADLGH